MNGRESYASPLPWVLRLRVRIGFGLGLLVGSVGIGRRLLALLGVGVTGNGLLIRGVGVGCGLLIAGASVG